MERYKKRTLALVLASVVTVVGAFGAGNYKNSLMSLKFNQDTGDIAKVTLFTKHAYEGNVNITKKDSYTYVVTLPEVNSEVANNYKLGQNIESVDIRTMPYTTSNNGYTKITIKTSSNIAMQAETSLYLPDKSPLSTETGRKISPVQQRQSQLPPERMAPISHEYNTIRSSNGVSQTSSVKLKDSVKQFQPPRPAQDTAVSPVSPAVQQPVTKTNTTVRKIKTGNHNNTQDLIYWILGILLVVFTSVYFLLRAKEKLVEITGERGNYDVSDEPKKTVKKEKPAKIRAVVKDLDKKYSKPVKMPVTSNNAGTDETAKFEPIQDDLEDTVVDLDELLQEKSKKNADTVINDNIPEENTEEEENSALEEFLSAYTFDDENDDFDKQEEKEEENLFDENLYNKCLSADTINFSRNDIDKINALINSEISDDTMKYVSNSLTPSSKKEQKLSPLERLENLVTAYTIQQNISFAKDDVDALYKLINVEIDRDFVTDLRTNPNRLKEMQEEIARQKTTPHKSSGLLTLNVKDMLPDLSEALKKQGGRKIESEIKPQVVYYSEGYDVSTLKLDMDLPDLAKEINNDSAYQSRPSDEIQYAETGYNVQKMFVSNELPDLAEMLENPEKYDTPEPEPETVDEETLLKNISNVTFKPFYDGTHDIEILNELDEKETPSIEDMQEEFNQIGEDFEIVNTEDDETEFPNKNDDINDFESLFDENYIDLDKTAEPVPLVSETEKNVQLPIVKEGEKPFDSQKLLGMIKDIEEKKKIREEELKEKLKKSSITKKFLTPEIKNPGFCILDNERYSVICTSNFTDNMGCYLAKNDNGYCVIGFVGDKTFKIRSYEKLKTEKLQSRASEKLEDGSVRYIVRIGIHKFIMNVKPDDMEFVMDLC